MKFLPRISNLLHRVVASNPSHRPCRRHQRARVIVQALEPRLLLTTAFDAVASETMLVYLVNQTRRNPTAAAARLGVSLPSGEIGPFAPLVVNSALQVAARLHSEDMLVNNYLSHTGLNGSSPGSRATAAARERTDPTRARVALGRRRRWAERSR